MSSTSPKPMAELAREYGLKAEEYALILTRLGREPNALELGVFSVMWSEHCSYKSSRPPPEDPAYNRPARDLRTRPRTPAWWTSATARMERSWPASSRWRATTTRAS